MNNLDEDVSCLSSSSLVENEVIVINGKIKPISLSDSCSIKLEDSGSVVDQNHHHSSHTIINQHAGLGLISTNQQFRRNSHLTLTSDFITDSNNNHANLNSTLIHTNNGNNNSNNIISNNNLHNNNNNNNNSVIGQSNGKVSVQYINVSYHPTTGLSNCSTVTSNPAVSTLVSSSNYKNDGPMLHPSTIKLEPLDISDKVGFNSITTTTVTTTSNSSIKLESSSPCETNKGSSSHLDDCFISCPVVDDLEVNSSVVKANLSLSHSHHSLNSHLHHHSHHHQHSHHTNHQRILISPTDFLSLNEESSVVSAVKKDVNLSTSRLEIIKKSNDTHELTVSLDRYCESPFLIDSHREIHLISDDDASNTERASRLSETHEEIAPEDLFASTLADDQHNVIREVVITPIESDTNSRATPTTLIITKTSSPTCLHSPIACSSPSLSSSVLSSVSSSISSSSPSSLTCPASLLTSTAVTDGLCHNVQVTSTSMINGFDLALVKEEKFDEESVEQMIVEDGTVDNDSIIVNGIVNDVDDDVDLLNSESRSASTSTVTTFSVLNTLHNNSSIRLTPEETSSSLELRTTSLAEQITSIPLQSSSSSSSSSLNSSSSPTLMVQIPSFSHFGKQQTSGSNSLVQITLPPTPTSSIATTPPTPTSTCLTPILSSNNSVGLTSSSPSSLSSSSPTSTSIGLIPVTTSSSTSSTSPVNKCKRNLINSNNPASQNASSSSNSSTSSSSSPLSSTSSNANVTLPLTPLDIKILPGGLLQFAANVAAVFPSSTILQKQLALQLLREDGTSIILPLTTRSGDSNSATVNTAFSVNNSGHSGNAGSGTSTVNHSMQTNSNTKTTTVSVLGNSSATIGGARSGGIVVASLGSGGGNLTETVPSISSSHISVTNERLEQPQQQTIVATTIRDPINSTKLLTSTETGQNPEIDRPFKCELCNSTFTRLGNYTRHKKIHSLPSKEDQRFRCDICGKSFIQRCDLARHLHIHRGTEPHRCSQCGKGYIRHSDLVTHQRFHNKEKPFACPHCSKGFCQRGDLNRHLRSIHLQLKPILCSHCHKKFAKEETLLRHINANHRDTVVT